MSGKPYGYELDRLDFDNMGAHEQEIFIGRYASAEDLVNIAFYYPAPDTFDLIAHRHNDKAARIISASPLARPSTLAYINMWCDTETRRNIAKNENTPEFVLGAMVRPQVSDKMTRIYAWRNPNLSLDDRTPENDPMGRE